MTKKARQLKSFMANKPYAKNGRRYKQYFPCMNSFMIPFATRLIKFLITKGTCMFFSDYSYHKTKLDNSWKSSYKWKTIFLQGMWEKFCQKWCIKRTRKSSCMGKNLLYVVKMFWQYLHEKGLVLFFGLWLVSWVCTCFFREWFWVNPFSQILQ